MKVTYLAHDGFMVDLNDVILAFDMVHDPSHSLKRTLDHRDGVPVVFFLSHQLVNNNHFNPGNFEIAQNHRRVYVVSNDIPAKLIPSTLEVAGMSAGDTIDNLPGGITVKAYKSTKGVAFVVTTKDGSKIMHCGDLNLWTLPSNSDGREANKAQEQFKTLVGRIASENPEVEVAMMSVNPRIGEDYARGAVELLNAIDVRDFFAMDIDGSALTLNDLKQIMPARTTAHLLRDPGESVRLEEVAAMAQ